MIFKNKRSETEIIYDLLLSAKKDVKKIRLMYKANMTYIRFMKYLDILVEKDLLGVKDLSPEGKVYYITEDGEKLLGSLNTVLTYFK